MPRYFFNVLDDRLSVDHEGIELVDAEAAYNQAIATTGELLKERGAKSWAGQALMMKVNDEDGRPVYTLTFSALKGAT